MAGVRVGDVNLSVEGLGRLAPATADEEEEEATDSDEAPRIAAAGGDEVHEDLNSGEISEATPTFGCPCPKLPPKSAAAGSFFRVSAWRDGSIAWIACIIGNISAV